MIRNYIKVAWRNLWRNKTFSFINITGLALGIAVFLFIMQYLAFEWGANRFNINYDNLYRAIVVDKDGKNDHFIAPGFAPQFKTAFPVINSYVRVADDLGDGLVNPNTNNKTDDAKAFREDKIAYVDGDIFKVFTLPLSQGTPSLNEPQTAALSASTAKKYFGDANAIGKTITVNNQFGHTVYTVNAVFNDFPEQSDIKANVLLSFKTLDNPALRDGNDWADPKGLKSGFVNVYFLLNDKVKTTSINNMTTRLMHQLSPDTKTDSMVFQPFSDMHIAPSFNYGLQTFGSLVLVSLFAAVALLILVIAWVNYINLSVAQSLKRAREIGVRKVLGAMRKQLMAQFLSETMIITLISCAVAIVLVAMLQPVYNSFLDKNLSLNILNQGWVWLIGIGFIIAGSLLSGSYVAFILSSFSPIKTIGNKIERITSGLSLRMGLVVFQFTISIVFIIATLVLYRQLQFMKTQDLGMQVDQRLIITGPSVNGSKLGSKSFKNQLAVLPFVKKYSASNDIPGRGYNFSANGITRINPNPGDEKKNYSMLLVDNSYFDTYDIKLAEGQNFSADNIDKGYQKAGTIIINQKAAEQFGFKPGEHVVGQKIMWGQPYEIVGVVKNYHHLSLHESIQPMVFLPAVCSGYYTIKLDAANMQTHIDNIKKLYQAQFPGNPFEYVFLDQNYDKQYRVEQKLGNVFIASALVAIFIACLGLFGLASFTAQQRTKEIGIRKVLGASVINIIRLISTDFLKLVAIAIVIASPIAWYAMNMWLQDFAYRVDINWWLFLLAGGIAVLIAAFTVSIQSVKAALANPVTSLRSE